MDDIVDFVRDLAILLIDNFETEESRLHNELFAREEVVARNMWDIGVWLSRHVTEPNDAAKARALLIGAAELHPVLYAKCVADYYSSTMKFIANNPFNDMRNDETAESTFFSELL